MKKIFIVLAVIFIAVFAGYGVFKNVSENKIKQRVEADLSKIEGLTFENIEVSTSISDTSVTIKNPTFKVNLNEQYEFLREILQQKNLIKSNSDEKLQWDIFSKIKELKVDVKNDKSAVSFRIVGPIEIEETIDGKTKKRKITSDSPIEYFISPNIFDENYQKSIKKINEDNVVDFILKEKIRVAFKSGKLKTVDIDTGKEILSSEAMNLDFSLDRANGKIDITTLIKNLYFTEYGNQIFKNHLIFKSLTFPETIVLDDIGKINADINVSGLFSEKNKTFDFKMNRINVSNDYYSTKYKGAINGSLEDIQSSNVAVNLEAETLYTEKWYNSAIKSMRLISSVLLDRSIRDEENLNRGSEKNSEDVMRVISFFSNNPEKILPRFHEHGKHIFKLNFNVASNPSSVPKVNIKEFLIADDKYSISISQPLGSNENLLVDKKLDIRLKNYASLVDDLTSYFYNFVSVLKDAKIEEIPSLPKGLNEKIKEFLSSIADTPNSNNLDIIISIDGNLGKIGSKDIAGVTNLANAIFAEEIRILNEFEQKAKLKTGKIRTK